MLASWMRLKYPHILDGAIAGSAPIWSYLGEHPVRFPSALAHIMPLCEHIQTLLAVRVSSSGCLVRSAPVIRLGNMVHVIRLQVYMLALVECYSGLKHSFCMKISVLRSRTTLAATQR